MKLIYIFGSGGVGREIVPIIDDMNEIKPRWNIRGILDDDDSKKGMKLGEHRVVGGREILTETAEPVHAVMGIADPVTKRKIIGEIKNPNVQWVSIIHPL